MRRRASGSILSLTMLGAIVVAFALGASLTLLLNPRPACSQETCPQPAGKPPPPAPGFQAIKFTDIDGWAADSHAPALAAFAGSCRRIADDPSRFAGGPFGKAQDWAAACRAALKTKPSDARIFFETWFEPARVGDGGGTTGKITGYYEPQLTGSEIKSEAFPAPVYPVPDDLVTVDPVAFAEILNGVRMSGRVVDKVLVPYDTRTEIQSGTLEARGIVPLLYLPSTADAFFLQIQGSGRVTLAEGGQVRVGYGAQNGHPYVAIGTILIERGEVEKKDMSMQAIRAWLDANPDDADALMNANPSYVFFVKTPLSNPKEGPPGAENVPLTPGRSLAVDNRVYPYGVPIFVDGEIATANGAGRETLRRLMIAQDTGGAIRGVVRGDVFFGWGEEAERRAGATDGEARFIVLRPRTMPAETQ